MFLCRGICRTIGGIFTLFQTEAENVQTLKIGAHREYTAIIPKEQQHSYQHLSFQCTFKYSPAQQVRVYVYFE